MIKSKSGLNINCNILSEGVIDSGYTGAIRVKLYNHGNKSLHIKRGDKITQLVVVPCTIDEVELVETLQETERGDRGFGSSGK
jgi:dUTP pyrophosphatase